ncbi:MAG: hypothetical protein ACOY99_01845 [Pseudomonadota bacterium]
MPIFTQLIKREIIEHRAGILITPAIIAGLIALILLYGVVSGSQIIRLGVDEAEIAQAMNQLEMEADTATAKIVAIIAVMMLGFWLPLAMVGAFVAFFMLLGSLYDERAERTILFWKSMPVSDTMTVFAKFITAALVIPLVIAVIAFILQLFGLTIFSIFSAANQLNLGAKIWTLAPMLTVWWTMLALVLLNVLWIAPVYGWLLLASAWAPRAPFLVAIVPIIALAVLEFLFLRSGHFIAEVMQRLTGQRMFSSLTQHVTHEAGASFQDIFSAHRIGLEEVAIGLSQPDLWIGLAVAAALFAGAIHIRRTKTL